MFLAVCNLMCVFEVCDLFVSKTCPAVTLLVEPLDPQIRLKCGHRLVLPSNTWLTLECISFQFNTALFISHPDHSVPKQFEDYKLINTNTSIIRGTGDKYIDKYLNRYTGRQQQRE